MLKHLMLAACIALPIAAYAAEEKKEPTPQQKKMAMCNKQAAEKQLKGDPRKAFMKECLAGSAQAAAPQK